jgi:hypothetical protein
VPNFGPVPGAFDDELNKIDRVVRLTTRIYKPKARRLAQHMRRARHAGEKRRVTASATEEWRAATWDHGAHLVADPRRIAAPVSTDGRPAQTGPVRHFPW